MRRIVIALTVAIIAAWVIGLWIMPPDLNIRGTLREMRYVTGLLAWTYMTLIVVIAARPAWLERVTGTPLDKLYVWHRYLGISAVVMGIIHFNVKPIFFPIISAIWTLQPLMPSGPKPPLTWDLASMSWSEILNNVYMWLPGFAKMAAEVILVFAVLSVIVALLRFIGYRTWLSLHRLLALAVLVMSVHTLRLADPADFGLPLGWINLAVTITAVIFSLKILLGRKGSAKTVRATVMGTETRHGVTLVRVKPSEPLHQRPGQFAFIKTPGQEKHPFTIMGHESDGTLLFAIKALGDYTRDVVPNFKRGMEIKLEGPWGGFTPQFDQNDQLWVAGGIGITPFLSWLQVAEHTKHGAITLCWCVKNAKEEMLLPRVQELAQKAHVNLVLFESGQKRLTPSELFSREKPSLVAVCGPKPLVASLKQAYVAAGGDKRNFLNEFFAWR